MFAAGVEAASKAKVTDALVRELAAYAIDRGDHSGTLHLLGKLGWPKDLVRFDAKLKLRAKLAGIPAGRAAAVGLLASVSSLLTVNEYSMPKPEALEIVVRSLGVDATKIRTSVTAEFAAKGKKPAAKKAVAKKASKKAVAKRPVLSGATRAKIAAAQKARWVKAKKAGRK